MLNIEKVFNSLGFSNEDETIPSVEYTLEGNIIITLPTNFFHIHSKNLKTLEEVLDELYDYSIYVSTDERNAPLCIMLIPIPN